MAPETDFIESPCRRPADLPAWWWDQALSGRLYRVSMESFHTTEGPPLFKAYAYRQAARRTRAVALNHKNWVDVYLQAYVKGQPRPPFVKEFAVDLPIPVVRHYRPAELPPVQDDALVLTPQMLAVLPQAAVRTLQQSGWYVPMQREQFEDIPPADVFTREMMRTFSPDKMLAYKAAGWTFPTPGEPVPTEPAPAELEPVPTVAQPLSTAARFFGPDALPPDADDPEFAWIRGKCDCGTGDIRFHEPSCAAWS